MPFTSEVQSERNKLIRARREAAEAAIWAPQPGPQSLACICPADVILFGGSRGGGKSDCAIGRQIQGALRHGSAWNGLFLRKNFKHFAELRRRIDELITKGLPAERVGGDGQTNRVKFKNGAMILLTAIEREDQLEFFQGQQMTEISIEEGCQFPFFASMVDKLKGCLRSPHGVACRMFVTANPGGPGHNQVKSMFKLGGKGVAPGTEISDGGDSLVFIPSSVAENKILCENDPKYVARLQSIKDPKLRAAWLEGDWDVVAGGYFDDVWDYGKHVVRSFHVPEHWERVCGLDWGSARPFSVGWYAVSGGEYLPQLGYALPRGSLVRYREWYGCVKDSPNVGLRLDSQTVARKILEKELAREEGDVLFDRIADPAIFKQDDGPSIAEKMAEEGVVFRKGDNKRLAGWDECRRLLQGSEGLPLFYVMENCGSFVETIPILSRDENEWDDLDSDQEDHIADEWRYVCMSRQGQGVSMLDLRPKKTLSELDHEDIAASDVDLDFESSDDPYHAPLDYNPEELGGV